MEQQQFDVILKRMDKQDDKLESILIQATKTNGRVSNHDKTIDGLTKDVESLKANRSETKGRDKTVWVVLVFTATVAGMLLQYYLSTKN